MDGEESIRLGGTHHLVPLCPVQLVHRHRVAHLGTVMLA